MNDRSSIEQHAAAAKIQTKRVFPIVWIIPLVALIIGGWLAYKAISEKGPTIPLPSPLPQPKVLRPAKPRSNTGRWISARWRASP